MSKEELNEKILFEEMLGKELHGHPDFYQLLLRMAEIHSSKNADYGGENSLGNFMLSEKMGIPAWKGALVRLGDKFSRIYNLARRAGQKATVSDETIEDTLIDMAIYSLLTVVLRKNIGK